MLRCSYFLFSLVHIDGDQYVQNKDRLFFLIKWCIYLA